jgi:hypothetical protein
LPLLALDQLALQIELHLLLVNGVDENGGYLFVFHALDLTFIVVCG